MRAAVEKGRMKVTRASMKAVVPATLCVCVIVAVLITPSAFTQTQTRPRKAASSSLQTSDQQKPEPAAGAQASQQVDDDEVVRIEASEVLLPVTVRDAGGQLISDLRRQDFRVFEDGREQPLSDLSLRRVPVDVALMVDSSSSVAASFEDFRRAAEEFAGRFEPGDGQRCAREVLKHRRLDGGVLRPERDEHLQDD